MIHLILIIAALAAADNPASRSRGYGGSPPVGLDNFLAGTTFDCAKINGDPRNGRRRTPLANACRLVIPSPDGRSIMKSSPTADDSMILKVTGGLVVRSLDQPAVILWNPNSRGFLLNGGEGSGQISQLRYFHRIGDGWRESRKLGIAASRLYKRRFDCRGGKDSYTNTSGWGWTSAGLLRVIVQEGVHSRGCLQPHSDHDVLFEVVGNPVTGRIASAREIAKLR